MPNAAAAYGAVWVNAAANAWLPAAALLHQPERDQAGRVIKADPRFP
jgi:hypothetical protein